MSRTTRSDVFTEFQVSQYRWSRYLQRLDGVLVTSALIAVVLRFGLPDLATLFVQLLSLLIVGSIVSLCTSSVVRYLFSRHRYQFLTSERTILGIHAFWVAGLVPLLLFGTGGEDYFEQRWELVLRWSEIVILLRAAVGGAEAVRNLHQIGFSPALVLVTSFVALIFCGTILLALPAARIPGAELSSTYPIWLIALYTSTSASCVTGLVIVDTGSYWSPAGQFIIMCLIQIGGLGIMTFGGFVGLISGRATQVGEDVMFRDLFDSDQIVNVRKMMLAILLFTLGSELLGAILLWGMWPELPFGQRVFYCCFHSIAAFCNAGFALPKNNANLIGYGGLWQVWGVIAGLVIVGGLGFGVLNDTATYLKTILLNQLRGRSFLRGHRPIARLGVNSGLVLLTTLVLLVGGTAGLYFLDDDGAIGSLQNPWDRLSAAWFQSVIARTAGFNTIDIAQLHVSSKLLIMALMFIGASPVSTGGGIKTTNLAIGVLSLITILRGRDHVEIWGRSISDSIVRKAATIMGTGGVIVIAATMCLCIFEGQQSQFLDYLFECTSAFATVGLSTGISGKLSQPSLLVITVTMFIGRVGQLTLFVALAGRVAGAHYQYPNERIALG